MKKRYALILIVLAFLSTTVLTATTARLDSIKMFELVEGETEFQPAGKFLFKYNAKNLIIEEEFFGMQLDDAVDVETDAFKLVYTYDAQDRIDMVTTIVNENGVYMEMIRETRMYNEENLLIKATQSFFDSETEEWTPAGIIDYVYENGKLQSKTNSFSAGFVTIIQSKTEYKYNSAGQITEEIEYMVDFLTQQLKPSYKTENIYADGKIDRIINYDANPITEGWMEDYAEVYVYDANNNPIEIIYNNWDSGKGEWVEDEKATNVFDNSYPNTTFILPAFFNEEAELAQILSNIITKSENFRKVGELYIKSDYSDIYWTIDGNTQVESLETSIATLYPNPNLGTFFVQLENTAEVTVLNLAGQSVYQSIIPAGSQEISLNNAQSGMYILHITEGKNTTTQKFIVK